MKLGTFLELDFVRRYVDLEDTPRKFFIDWFVTEDYYFGSTALEPQQAQSHNAQRKKYFAFYIAIPWAVLNLRINLKMVGQVYFGRDLSNKRKSLTKASNQAIIEQQTANNGQQKENK